MRTIGALVFPGFELLDLFGPLEMFGLLEDDFEIRLVSQSNREVQSGMGPVSLADDVISDDRDYDILLIPGGPGIREGINNDSLIQWLCEKSSQAELIASVCTGSALLAKAGLLDGRQATTNKLAFDWVSSQGPDVRWQKHARWVSDGRFFTSSGVSAGTDMALAVIEHLLSMADADQVALWAEYAWNRDADNDPFAIE